MELNNYTDYGKEALLKVEEALSDIKNIYNQLASLKNTSNKKWNMPLGCIFAVAGQYDGDRAVKLDGAVLNSASYPEFYSYIIANSTMVTTCTNDEFEALLASSGHCEKFVIDEANATVRIPHASGLATIVGANFSPLYIVVKCDET